MHGDRQLPLQEKVEASGGSPESPPAQRQGRLSAMKAGSGNPPDLTL